MGAPLSVQSGGTYSPKLFIESNDKDLKYDCIVIGLGTMYRSYNTFISRTLLIDPTEEQKKIYSKVGMDTKILTNNLKAGVKINDAYKSAKNFMQDNLPMIDIPKNFGYGVRMFLCRWEFS
jgi:nucleosome binding factor SPN SPT16 subunit